MDSTGHLGGYDSRGEGAGQLGVVLGSQNVTGAAAHWQLLPGTAQSGARSCRVRPGIACLWGPKSHGGEGRLEQGKIPQSRQTEGTAKAGRGLGTSKLSAGARRRKSKTQTWGSAQAQRVRACWRLWAHQKGPGTGLGLSTSPLPTLAATQRLPHPARRVLGVCHWEPS